MQNVDDSYSKITPDGNILPRNHLFKTIVTIASCLCTCVFIVSRRVQRCYRESVGTVLQRDYTLQIQK